MNDNRKILAQLARLAYDKGYVNAIEGNLSIREGDRIYITPSGISKGILNESMVVVTDLNGQVLEGSFKPSSEIKLHLLAYQKRTDIRSVVHSHTPYLTAFAVANQPVETKAYPEMIVFFESFPLADYGTPSTDEIFTGVERYIKDHDVILLANHGVMTLGNDFYDGFHKLEAAESIAKVLFLARQLGGEKSLSESHLQKLYDMRKDHKIKSIIKNNGFK